MKSDLKNIIGKRIQEIRLQEVVTQAELAEMADLSTPYISYIECGKKMPSIPSLLRIVNSLGVTFNEVMYGLQKYDDTAYQTEMDVILSECNDDMKRIIYEIVRFFINIMKENFINEGENSHWHKIK